MKPENVKEAAALLEVYENLKRVRTALADPNSYVQLSLIPNRNEPDLSDYAMPLDNTLSLNVVCDVAREVVHKLRKLGVDLEVTS